LEQLLYSAWNQCWDCSGDVQVWCSNGLLCQLRRAAAGTYEP